jgi:nitroimidazol reductase NimA-like FMN-containing flavoprotein (pyridoxamine 5'-phosphate oxidase superfamily)
MKADSDALSPEECLDLLGSVPIGRVVYTDRALPAVLPVNFVLDHGDVTIHTGSNATLAAALGNTVVAFHADEFDPVTAAGWAVTVLGRARLVDDPAEIERAAALPLRPWVRAPHGVFVRIPIRQVSGDRMGPAVSAHAVNAPIVPRQAC